MRVRVVPKFGIAVLLATIMTIAGCSSSAVIEPLPQASPGSSTMPLSEEGPYTIYGYLERQEDQNLIHVYVNGVEVIDGELSAEYEGVNYGSYGARDVRSECRTRRLNLHDFRVTCDVYVDDTKESSFGF